MEDTVEAAAEAAPDEVTWTPRQKLLKEIGRKLIHAREARGEPLSKVVRKLKLRQAHLEALESGNWDSLPDDVYALGFLRQYSTYLALDLNEDIQRIKNDQYALTRPLTFPDPPVAPSRRWSWIAAAAFIALFILFNIIDLDLSPPSEPAKQETRVATAEPPAAPPATDAPADLTPPADESPQPAADAPTSETPAEPEPESSPEPAPLAEPAAPTAAQTDNAPTEEPAAAATHTFHFEAVSDAVWMQIFLPDESGQAKGKLRKEALLESGASFTISEAVESLWITCGNPVALRISVDGKVVSEPGSLGPAGKVLRDYRFQINP